MDLDSAMAFVSRHKAGVLMTIRGNGRPQSSNVNFAANGETIRVSVTDGRAKVANLRRDPRVSLHVSSDDFWSYAVVEGTADLSPVAAAPGDPTVVALRQLFRDVQGEHPDWDDYDRAMVEDRRLVLTIRPERAYGFLRG